MKKISFLCIVCLCASKQTNAQLRDTTLNTNTHKVDANSLFQESKKQKTAAWLLLGGGAGLATAGYIVAKNAAFNNPFEVILGQSSKETTGLILLFTGGAAMVGS